MATADHTSPRPHAPVRVGVDKAGEGRIMRDRCKPFVRPTPSKGGDTMSLMCSMQVCRAQAGLCGHEKMMFGIAVLLVAGAGAYFFLG
jgi:hypothetical protein